MRLALLASLRAEPIVPPIFIDVQRGQSVALPWDSLQHGFFMHAKRAMPHGALVAISLVDRHTRIPVMQAVVILLVRSQHLRNEAHLFQEAVQGRGRGSERGTRLAKLGSDSRIGEVRPLDNQP